MTGARPCRSARAPPPARSRTPPRSARREGWDRCERSVAWHWSQGVRAGLGACSTAGGGGASTMGVVPHAGHPGRRLAMCVGHQQLQRAASPPHMPCRTVPAEVCACRARRRLGPPACGAGPHPVGHLDAARRPPDHAHQQLVPWQRHRRILGIHWREHKLVFAHLWGARARGRGVRSLNPQPRRRRSRSMRRATHLAVRVARV